MQIINFVIMMISFFSMTTPLVYRWEASTEIMAMLSLPPLPSSEELSLCTTASNAATPGKGQACK